MFEKRLVAHPEHLMLLWGRDSRENVVRAVPTLLCEEADIVLHQALETAFYLLARQGAVW